MLRAFTGFVIIGVLVVVGYGAERLRLAGPNAGYVLNRVAFFVASPALLFTVVAHADVHVLFSRFIAVAAVAALVVAGLFVLASRLWFRSSLVATTMGAACSAYVNSNNIGLPVATYIVGNAQYVAPQILLQVLVFSPVILVVLDLSTRGGLRLRDILAQPVRNPIVLAVALGAVFAVVRWQVPDVVLTPLQVLGGAAVPLMLMAFGMSLVDQRPLAPGTGRRAVVVATGLKAVVMPGVALVVGLAMHLEPHLLFAVVVTAALPTAQNMNNYASRYGVAEVLARDAVLLSTLAAVPVILLVTALLHP